MLVDTSGLMCLFNQRDFRQLNEQAMRLLTERSDKLWSLCDAVSFVLMKDKGLLDALTTDHNFEQAGFVRLLAQ